MSPKSQPIFADPDTKEVITQGVAELGSVLIGSFFVRRKLRRLGASEKQVYVLSLLFTSLFWIRLDLKGIRRELRLQRLKAAKTHARPFERAR